MKWLLYLFVFSAVCCTSIALALEKEAEDVVGPDGAVAASSIPAFNQSLKLFKKQDKAGLKAMLNEGKLVKLNPNDHVTRLNDKWKYNEMGGEIPLTKIRYKGKIYWTTPNSLVNGISGHVQSSIQQQNNSRTPSEIAQEKKLRESYRQK